MLRLIHSRQSLTSGQYKITCRNLLNRSIDRNHCSECRLKLRCHSKAIYFRRFKSGQCNDYVLCKLIFSLFTLSFEGRKSVRCHCGLEAEVPTMNCNIPGFCPTRNLCCRSFPIFPHFLSSLFCRF